MSDNACLNGYPTISYKNDYYNSWLAQNSEIISLQSKAETQNYILDVAGKIPSMISNMTSMLSGGSGANAGQISGFGGYIKDGLDLNKMDINHENYVKMLMAQQEKQKLLPDQANLSSSNATLLGYDLMDDNIFTRYTIKKQFAERIDKYFDMYGYLTNTLKIPNINNRPNWNYIKTQGANITANIPQNDLLAIKNMFDNGITLWHNTNNFLNYSVNNR